MKVELEIIRGKIRNTSLIEGDRLEKKSKLARKRLAEVSKNFDTYDEDQVTKSI